MKQQEFESVLNELLNQYFELAHNPIEGAYNFYALNLKKEIKLYSNNKRYTMHEGLYFVVDTEISSNSEGLLSIENPQYCISSEYEYIYNVDIRYLNGIDVLTASKLEPMKLDNRELTLSECLLWCAYDNDRKTAKALFNYAGKEFMQYGALIQDQTIPKQNTEPVYNFINPVTRISQSLTNFKTGVPFAINVAEQKANKSVNVLLSLELPNQDAMQSTKTITPYDVLVHNSVVSLEQAGNIYFTDRQLWHVYSQKANSMPTTTVLKELNQSLEKQMSTIITLDYTEQIKKQYPKAKVQSTKYKGTLLQLDKVEVKTANGEKVTGYKINRTPILYTYADQINQLVRIKTYILKTALNGTEEKKGVIKATSKNCLLANYLLQRIEQCKNPKMSKRILYSTVYEKLNLTHSSKDIKKRTRVTTKRILDNIVKSKQTILKGWKEYRYPKTSRKITGIELEVNVKKKN